MKKFLTVFHILVLVLVAYFFLTYDWNSAKYEPEPYYSFRLGVDVGRALPRRIYVEMPPGSIIKGVHFTSPLVIEGGLQSKIENCRFDITEHAPAIDIGAYNIRDMTIQDCYIYSHSD